MKKSKAFPDKEMWQDLKYVIGDKVTPNKGQRPKPQLFIFFNIYELVFIVVYKVTIILSIIIT